MTKFQLKFWAKGDEERVYVEGIKDAPYFSRTFAKRPLRSTSSGYYDRHRIAKGDLGGEREFTLVINGDQALGNAILDGAGVKMLNDIDGNPVEFSFIDVATRARFGPPAWFGNTPAKDRKRIDRERDDAVYTLHSAA